MKQRNALFALALVVLPAGVCSAQFSLRGSITGIVTDASHAVVPGAKVTLTDVDRNQVFQAETNATGAYTFTELTIGRYQISLERTGFRPVKSTVIPLATGQSQRIDFVLELGAITQAVDVSAAAPLLETGQSVVGVSVQQEFLSSLPVKGRNFTAFALLAPNIYSFASNGNGGGVSYVAGGGGDNGMDINGG